MKTLYFTALIAAAIASTPAWAAQEPHYYQTQKTTKAIKAMQKAAKKAQNRIDKARNNNRNASGCGYKRQQIGLR